MIEERYYSQKELKQAIIEAKTSIDEIEQLSEEGIFLSSNEQGSLFGHLVMFSLRQLMRSD